jgi:LPXTG-motif cell wall-anchored protein
MSQAAFAETDTVVGGTYTYNGDTITDTTAPDLDKQITGLEPGDSRTITFEYTNDSDATTYWYMENTIVKSLEEAADQNGGYTYILKDNGEVIFSSDAVGGEQNSEGISQGLKGVNDALKGDGDQWFFIQELGPGASGKTELYVALDGESQVNSYENKNGQLQVNYAVEKQAPGKDKVINKPGTSTKTGDSFNPWFAILALTAALLAALLAILSYFRDRKDGEEA